MSTQKDYTKVMLGKSFLDVVKDINANFVTVKENIVAAEDAAKSAASTATGELQTTVANLQKQADATDATVTANKTATDKAISDLNTNLTAEINKKATKATTLAGYGITDAKIANGVITLGSNTITPLTQHQSLAAYAKTADVNTAIDNAKKSLRDGLVKVVTAVPTTDNAEAGIIYLVKVGGSEANNAYAEYVLATAADGTKSIEKLGDLKLDLSAYAKTADVNTALDKKVDKVTGKVLSTNDYTTDEKNKLAGIATGATKVIVDSALSSTSTNAIQNKVVNSALAGKVATSTYDTDKTNLNNAIAAKDAVSKVALTTAGFGTADATGVFTQTLTVAANVFPTGIVLDSNGTAMMVDVTKSGTSIVVKSMVAFAGNVLVTTTH